MASAAPSFLGTSRNLTDKFLRFRAQARDTSGGFGGNGPSRDDLAREKASARLLDTAIGSSGGSGNGIAVNLNDGASSLPPAWVDFSEEAERDVSQIKEKLRELSGAHAKALLPTFDDMGGESGHAVEACTQEITKLFKRCEGRLQRLGDRGHGRFGDENNPEERKVVKNVQTKLASELHKLSAVFRKTQKEYLNRLQEQEGRGPGGQGVDDVFAASSASHGQSGNSLSYDQSDSRQYDDHDRDFGFSATQMQRVDRVEAVSFERDQEVVNILRSVNDLAGVMKDLSVLIIDQGTVLDRIDYNCEMVAVTVEEGRKQLTKAEGTRAYDFPKSGGATFTAPGRVHYVP